MYFSKLLIPTLKESPADAEVASHKLMVRAGMIRQLAAGIYSILPLGLRVLKKVEAIIREEMDQVGGQEVFLPSIQPAELWQESKRWDFYGKATRFAESYFIFTRICQHSELVGKASTNGSRICLYLFEL